MKRSSSSDCRVAGHHARHCALALAEAKAASVSAQFPQAVVIGADQMLVCGGERFDKPADIAAAPRQLRDFSDALLDDYLDREGEAILGSVGAYRLKGRGVQLFARVDGDYFAVLGLPLLPLLEFLRAQGDLAG